MKLSLKHIFAASAMMAASASAFADATVPTLYQNSSTAPAAFTTDTTTDGGLVFNLFDSVGGTTYAMTYYLGLDLSSVLPTNMDDAGLTLTWHIDTSTATAYGTSNLVWGVAAGDNGVQNTDGSTSMVSTVDTTNGSQTVINNGGLITAANNIDVTYQGANEDTAALDISTSQYSTRDLLNKIGTNMGVSTTYDWVASAANASDTLSMYYYTQNGGRNQGDALATSTLYAGLWSFDITSGTLTYSVAGGAPVPLPAALWLLLSGLGGLGVIGRRRQA